MTIGDRIKNLPHIIIFVGFSAVHAALQIFVIRYSNVLFIYLSIFSEQLLTSKTLCFCAFESQEAVLTT
jgi:hypothetical protein